MALPIFYSWQSDVDAKINRYFIEDSLKRAVRALPSDPEVIPALREYGGKAYVDTDTKGVPGTPEISNVIFDKITNSQIYVADLTFVGKSADGRPLQNPNVLIEYGWALGKLGDRRVIALMNTAYGRPSQQTMPFNMRHRRYPITYSLDKTADSEVRRTVREDLVGQLSNALMDILNSEGLNSTGSKEHVDIPEGYSPSIFLNTDEELGRPEGPFAGNHNLYLISGQDMFLRLLPSIHLDPLESSNKLKKSIANFPLSPFGWPSPDLYGRNNHGAFVSNRADEEEVKNVTQVFLNREIWGLDTALLDRERSMAWTKQPFGVIPSVDFEQAYLNAMTSYMRFMNEVLQVPLPVRFIAGVKGIKGYKMGLAHNFAGNLPRDVFIYPGEITDYEVSAQDVLHPYFERLWDEFGLDWPPVA